MTNIKNLPKKPKPPSQPPTGGTDYIAIARRLSALLGLPVPTESVARVVAALDHCYERGHKAAMESRTDFATRSQISLQNANESRKKSQLENEKLKERIVKSGLDLHRAVRDAVKEEREACAKACEEVRDDCWSGSKEYEAAVRCVEAIRSLSNQ